MIAGLEPEELTDLILSIGTHRGERRLSPIEVATLVQRARQSGASLSEIAEMVGLAGTSMLGRFVRLLDLDGQVRLLVDWGNTDSTIGFSSATELSRLAESDQREAATAILERRFSSAEVKQLIQLRKRSDLGIQACLDQVERMRPQIDRRHILVGTVIETETRLALEAIAQRERDEIMGLALETIIPRQVERSHRLGSERFLIVGDDGLEAVLRDLPGGFEIQVNERLRDWRQA